MKLVLWNMHNGNDYIIWQHKILNIKSTVTQNMHISKYKNGDGRYG